MWKSRIRWLIASIMTMLFSMGAFALPTIDLPGATSTHSSLMLEPVWVPVDADPSNTMLIIIDNIPDMAMDNYLMPEQTDYGWYTFQPLDLVTVDASARHMRYEVGWQNKQR